MSKLNFISESDFKVLEQRVKGSTGVSVMAGQNTRTLPRSPSPSLPRELVLIGQIPSGKNNMQVTRDGQHYPNLRFQLWRDQAVFDVMQQWRKLAPIATPIHLTCRYWPGDKRTRDVSGMLDALFHVLVKAGVVQDDGLIHNVMWWREGLNRKGAKVLMNLLEMP